MAEDKFLAFKGLKQYDPDSGWASVDPAEEARRTDHETYYDPSSSDEDKQDGLYIDPHFEKNFSDLSLEMEREYDSPAKYQQSKAQQSSVDTGSQRNGPSSSSRTHYAESSSAGFTNAEHTDSIADPLLSELFEQLNQPPQDELTQNWKIIATSVNILSQRMAQRRDLKDRLIKLDRELDSLRSNILHDLEDIQKAADQQLSMARLRAEVSTLAQARLASRLKQHNKN